MKSERLLLTEARAIHRPVVRDEPIRLGLPKPVHAVTHPPRIFDPVVCKSIL
jgi:hypothetical protein